MTGNTRSSSRLLLLCIWGNMTPRAPPSKTRCTNPSPHWYGTRTNGVIPIWSPAEQSALAWSRDRVECSNSMKRESKPAFFASLTIWGLVTNRIPNACFMFYRISVNVSSNHPAFNSTSTDQKNLLCITSSKQHKAANCLPRLCPYCEWEFLPIRSGQIS